MRKSWLFIIAYSLFLLGCKCNAEKKNYKEGINIEVKEIHISHYEDDSLNKSRPSVVPRIYYVFGYENNTTDSVYIKLASHFENNANSFSQLFVTFEYEKIVDTLLLTDYESVNPILLEPKTNSKFTIGVPVLRYLNQHQYSSESEVSLMTYISKYGVINFINIQRDESLLIHQSRLLKFSKDFEIKYRDPLDTAIE